MTKVVQVDLSNSPLQLRAEIHLRTHNTLNLKVDGLQQQTRASEEQEPEASVSTG